MNFRFCIARFLEREITPSRALAVVVSLTVAACAGSNATPVSSIANPVSQRLTSRPGISGVPAVRVKPDKASYKRALYILDRSNNIVKIFTNNHYRDMGVIIKGISAPTGMSMDQRGNLYVANEIGLGSSPGDVTEYAAGRTSPSFTYSANMHFVANVTVDSHGNVYEADVAAGGGFINEYPQGTNAVSQSCSLASYVQPVNVAVDPSGDVFVGTQLNGIYEYSGGLSGCSSTLLNSISANDMVLDSNNNLIVSDNSTNAVEVLDPPYTTVSRTIGSGFSFPVGLSLHKSNKWVFVTDLNNDTITVINYQTGQNVEVLNGVSFGISQPVGVVDAPNAVY